jgi:hypothetical protein
MPINLESANDLTPRFASFSKLTEKIFINHAPEAAVSEVNKQAVDDTELLEYYFDNLT